MHWVKQDRSRIVGLLTGVTNRDKGKCLGVCAYGIRRFPRIEIEVAPSASVRLVHHEITIQPLLWSTYRTGNDDGRHPDTAMP